MDDWVDMYLSGMICEEEFEAFLEAYAEIHGRASRRPPWYRTTSYRPFSLDRMSDNEVLRNFRFRREDLTRLQSGLEIPNEVIIPDRGYRLPGTTAMCMALRRLAYPNRLSDLERVFAVSGPMISSVSNYILRHIVTRKGHLVTDLRAVPWLTPEKLTLYAAAIAGKGAPLQNCWGFIDGTARKMCRPTVDQKPYYSGHKRYHCLKYQSIVAPDGIILNMSGPFQGSRHDAGILRMSHIDEQLRAVCQTPTQKWVLYGDPAYPLSDVIISPFPASASHPNAAAFNRAMSSVRQSVEWGFAKIIRDWAFLDFHQNQQLLKQALPTMFKAGTLLTNCHTCLYGGQIPQQFCINPPTLEEYLTV